MELDAHSATRDMLIQREHARKQWSCSLKGAMRPTRLFAAVVRIKGTSTSRHVGVLGGTGDGQLETRKIPTEPLPDDREWLVLREKGLRPRLSGLVLHPLQRRIIWAVLWTVPCPLCDELEQDLRCNVNSRTARKDKQVDTIIRVRECIEHI
jgi:hypothetical protein